MIYILAFLGVCFAAWSFFNAHKPHRKFPTGPRGLPVLGNLHQLGSQHHKWYTNVAKKYGQVFSLRLGSSRAIVLNNHNDIMDALAKQEFSGRVDRRDRCGEKPRGLIFNSGTSFTEQRRFTLKTLRDMGLGRKCMEEKLLLEVKSLLEFIQLSAGKPIEITNLFNVATLNALWILVAHIRFPQNDNRLKALIGVLHSSRQKSKISSLLRHVTFLDKIMEIVKRLVCSKNTGKEEITKFIEESVKLHQQTIQDITTPRDFIDAYLMEIEKTTDRTSSFFQDEGMKNLQVTLHDLFAAGAETTATALSWTMLLLAKHPDKQKKLRKEICTIVGQSRLPVLEDRSKMPFTQAVIHEVLRFTSIAPLAVAHCATEDTNFRNYFIPKGTLVIPNLYGTMHDPKVWTNPDVFRPERFLLNEPYTLRKYDAFLPFSAGKRVCPGASFALDELFLFTAGLFQRVQVKPDPNGKPINLTCHSSTVLVPQPQNLMFLQINDQ